MATEDESRRPRPLGLVGLSRGGFLPRPGETGRSSSRPLGLAGRAAPPSFSIGTAGFEPLAQAFTVHSRRRVGLMCPPRQPPPADESGPSNWTASSSGGSSTYVGFSIAGLGVLSFGGVSGISIGGY